MRWFDWQRLFEEAGDGGAGGGQGTGQATETPEQKIARLERENGEFKSKAEENERKAKEHEESAKFWHERAKGSAPANRDGQERPKPQDDPEDDNTDFLALAAQGPKAVKNWLKAQGMVTRAEAEAMTNAKATQLMRQAEIVRNHPELNDQQSDFFKETTAEYQKLKARGIAELDALELAADRVALTRKAKAGDGEGDNGDKGDKGKGNGRGKETDEERRARAKAQNGDGRRGAAAEESDELDDNQKRIAEAFGISEDAYKKRAKEGVQFGRQ